MRDLRIKERLLLVIGSRMHVHDRARVEDLYELPMMSSVLMILVILVVEIEMWPVKAYLLYLYL